MAAAWLRERVGDGKPPLPNFLVIGAQKSGTRWLRSNLGEHPQVLAVDQELWYFNDGRGHWSSPDGTSWYREQFAAWEGEPFLGEASPGYMMLRHDPEVVAARIHDLVPDVRLFAVLRNPVDRAYSAMVHHIANRRIPPGANLVELVRTASSEDALRSLVEGGMYATSLEPFVDRFGAQLLVILHDDVTRDPTGVYATALDHLGATPGFVPDGVADVRFSNQQVRLSSPKTWTRARYWPTTKAPARLRPEDRLEVYELFRDEVRRLETMFHIDLSAWDPATTAAGRSRAT